MYFVANVFQIIFIFRSDGLLTSTDFILISLTMAYGIGRNIALERNKSRFSLKLELFQQLNTNVFQINVFWWLTPLKPLENLKTKVNNNFKKFHFVNI